MFFFCFLESKKPLRKDWVADVFFCFCFFWFFLTIGSSTVKDKKIKQDEILQLLILLEPRKPYAKNNNNKVEFILKKLLISTFIISFGRFREFDAGNVPEILLQIKIFGGNMKETMLTRYFIKVTARPGFTWLGVIKQINRAH